MALKIRELGLLGMRLQQVKGEMCFLSHCLSFISKICLYFNTLLLTFDNWLHDAYASKQHCKKKRYFIKDIPEIIFLWQDKLLTNLNDLLTLRSYKVFMNISGPLCINAKDIKESLKHLYEPHSVYKWANWELEELGGIKGV